MKITVSGLVNIETTLKVREFPINYYPIDYPFFGIKSSVSGVAYNISKALRTLGNEVGLFSIIGKDHEGERILKKLEENDIKIENVKQELEETPQSVILYDNEGKRQIYCDLKDIQEKEFECAGIKKLIDGSDIIVAGNINFSRPLLKYAKSKGKIIAADVHVLEDIQDDYNRDFMEYSDILFLSDERISCEPEKFIRKIKDNYGCKIVVIGQGSKGALLYERESDTIYDFDSVSVGKVINTVGAGDALFASFLNYYGKGHKAVEALKRAEIFASKKIGFNGAAAGFIHEKEVEELYMQHEIKLRAM